MFLHTERNLWKWMLCGVALAAGGAMRAQTFEVSPFAAYLPWNYYGHEITRILAGCPETPSPAARGPSAAAPCTPWRS